MNHDYRAEEGDLECPVQDCTNAAQDGWWLFNGLFRYACLTHAQMLRSSDMPDGILEAPPSFTHDAMNPKNVPKPNSTTSMRAAMKPSSPAMHRWVHQIRRDLGGGDEELRTICGDGYRNVQSLSQHAIGWLLTELQHAWLTLRPVPDDD